MFCSSHKGSCETRVFVARQLCRLGFFVPQYFMNKTSRPALVVQAGLPAGRHELSAGMITKCRAKVRTWCQHSKGLAAEPCGVRDPRWEPSRERETCKQVWSSGWVSGFGFGCGQLDAQHRGLAGGHESRTDVIPSYQADDQVAAMEAHAETRASRSPLAHWHLEVWSILVFLSHILATPRPSSKLSNRCLLW